MLSPNYPDHVYSLNLPRNGLAFPLGGFLWEDFGVIDGYVGDRFESLQDLRLELVTFLSY